MKEVKGQDIIHCPQCGENKVKSNAIGSSQVSLLIGVLLCITVVGLPFGIALIIISLYTKKSKMRFKFTCQECKHTFKVKEQTYEEYEAYLKAN
ncbi:hypothetical protein [Bacillus infantis]|uniref:hypothetical protein n=1 Tax=Bacillus infantis TaxID=324767 RepID=UPI003CFAF82D